MKNCKKCGKNKDHSEFNNKKASKDGLQEYCKECCKEASKQFRKLNPDYYWGKPNSYFSDKLHVEKLNDQLKANKSIKIYKITLPEGVYIGATKKHLWARIAAHRSLYTRYKKGLYRSLPLLYKALDAYDIDTALAMFDNNEIIEEFEGTRTEMHRRERYWLKLYSQNKINLLNKNI